MKTFQLQEDRAWCDAVASVKVQFILAVAIVNADGENQTSLFR
jgi:hypothetical protein